MKALLFAAAAVLAGLSPGFAAADVSTPLIERNKLFGNPSRSRGLVSPDGKWFSFMAPREGVLNVWIAPVGALDQARPLTTEAKRPVYDYFWAPDSQSILYQQDTDGDENFKLYGVNVVSGAQKVLTPFDNTRVFVYGVSNKAKDRILIGINKRDPKWHDAYSLDLKSGKLTKVFENQGSFSWFYADQNLALRAAERPSASGGSDYFKIADNKAADKPFASTNLEDSRTTRPLGFSSDGKMLYWLDARGRDKAALVAQDFATGKLAVIAESDKADVSQALANPGSGVPDVIAVNYLTTEWSAADPALQDDFAFLKAKLHGEMWISSRADADDLWTVGVDAVTTPPTLYLYDRKARTLTPLYVNRPELVGAGLVPMHPVEIKTRDGLTEVSYLTLPPGSDKNADGKPDKPVAMVLDVHGGPWVRDEYGYSSEHQWLANRGYAVLSVNYRGSQGFGKAYITAGDRQWGRKMHDDLIDAVDWAVKNGVALKDKICIMGGSYGGYATLAGLAFTPDEFACGVDIVGPSNLVTMQQDVPAYYEPIKAMLYKRIGDPMTEEGRQQLLQRSPLFKADRIKKPLLIGQGANDPRVKQSESDQIVQAMAGKAIPVTYVLFPDEGHGFARPENRIAFYAIAEQFLAKTLDGRAEPIGDDVKKSSAQVPQGAAFAPGLSEALAGN
jgi:dipeptidyl aminopeptidase/acylaminoacyl peptidase